MGCRCWQFKTTILPTNDVVKNIKYNKFDVKKYLCNDRESIL